MPSTPRTPSDHYGESERLLRVAESSGTDRRIQQVAALTAIGHALLAAAPRRARRQKSEHAPTSRPVGDRWMFGHDQDGQS